MAVMLGTIAMPIVDERNPAGPERREAFILLMRDVAADFVQIQCGVRPEIGEMVPIDDRSPLAEAVPMGRA